MPKYSDYRAAPITQKDGSSLQNSNCRMASIATGIDHHTTGSKKSTGAKMRSYSGDTSGGTNATGAVKAWQSGYSEALSVRNSRPWSEVIADLKSGRGVELDVWHEAVGGPCLSGSGRYGHSIAIAPEQSGTRWLTSDPWCKPAKWVWWEEAKLRKGAEVWADKVRTGTAGGKPVEEVIREFMSRFYPENEAGPDDLPETGGPATVYYTRTRAQPPAPPPEPPGGGGGGSSVAGDYAVYDTEVESRKIGKIAPSTPFYNDWSFTDKRGTFGSNGGTVQIMGYRGDAYAIQVTTSQGWSDGKVRPTLTFVKKTAISDIQNLPEPTPVPPEPPLDCAAQVEAAIQERDDQWREWLDAAPEAVAKERREAEQLTVWAGLAPDQT